MEGTQPEKGLIRWEPISPNIELRADSAGGPGIIHGPLMVYGDVAKVYGIEEDVLAGAFGDLTGQTILANRMHVRAQALGNTGNGRVVVRDSAEMLYVELTLPDTTLGRDTATEVADGVLTGFSPEMLPGKFEQRAGRVTHTRLFLRAFGVVDIPAYRLSKAAVELRMEQEAEEAQEAAARRAARVARLRLL